MDVERLKKNAILYGWEFFERTLSHYSFVIRMLDRMAKDCDPVSEGPRIFVEELGFDVCKIVVFEGSRRREGVFSTEEGLDEGLSCETISALMEGKEGPLSVPRGFKLPILIFPLREGIERKGFILLGSKSNRDDVSVRELEILAELYGMCLRCEKRLEQKESLSLSYRAVLDALPFCLFVTDEEGRVFFVNRRAEERFSMKGVEGEYVGNILPCLTQEILKRKDSLSEEVSFHEAGEYRFLLLQLIPLGRRRIVLLSDLSEKRVLEEREIRRSKMEIVGLLAGGLAHDFNNVLTGILGYASLLKDSLKGDEKLARFAEIIESSARRGASLTQHLLNFYRRKKRAFGPVNVNSILEDVLFLLKEGLKEIEVVRELDARIPLIRADESGLQQVFLNLCMNARDAMEGRGVLTVRTGTRKYLRGREYLYVSIEDTGKGMDEQTKRSIFEPFFSTKEREESLGLGLYFVKSVVKEHNGLIDVESEEGEGTKFTIYLPVEAIEEQPNKDGEVNNGVPMSRRALVVDDEAVIRELLRNLLEGQGFEVLEASDGKEALEVLEREGGNLDLLILDVIMPGMKGDEVLKRVKERRKEIKVVLSSGFMSEEHKRKMKKLGADGFLDKPYRALQVRELISSLFSSELRLT